MTTTTFVPGTVVASTWLNDVNTAVYKAASGSIGSVDRTAVDKFTERVSIKDFGVSTTNTRAQNDAALYAALNSGNKTLYIPNGTYLLSARNVITAAAGITLIGEDPKNTILSWAIDIATTDKFAFVLDAFVNISNVSIVNTGTDATTSGGLVSYTPTVANGMRNCVFKNVYITGFGAPIGATINGTSLSLVRSQVFSNVFENMTFTSCGSISLGSGVNNNIFIRPAFITATGTRHIKFVEGSSNLLLSPQFEPVAGSVAPGFLNAEFVLSPNNMLINPYFEPCYGIVADASPGTVVDGAIIESFDFTIGTLSSSAILRSTNASNAGVYSYPIVSRVSVPVSRAAVNPVSYCASDDNSNTITLVDSFTTRDSNFKLKPVAQTSKISINTQGTWVPTLTGTTAGGGGNTYTQQSGHWIRNGNSIDAWFRIAISAKDGALAGNAQISNLPFRVANLSLYGPSITFSEYLVDLSVGYSQLIGEGTANTTNALLVQGGDNITVLALPVTGLLNNTVLIGNIRYITDAN